MNFHILKLKPTAPVVSDIKAVLLECAIFFSVLSQYPSDFGGAQQFIDVTSRWLWIAILCYCAVKSDYRIRLSDYTTFYAVVYSCFFFYCGVLTLLFQTEHLSGGYLRTLSIPLLLSIVGDFYSNCTEELLQKFIRSYIFSALIYAIWIHVNFFTSYVAWIQRLTYVFGRKNSAGQILASAIILLLFAIKYQSVAKRIAGMGIALYLFFIVGLIQCRTAMVAMAVIVCYHVLRGLFKKPALMLTLIVAIGLTISLPVLREFIIKSMLLRIYSGRGLDTLLSGRLILWTRAINAFRASPLIGTGQYYVDCFYISLLAESGVIGFSFVIILWACKFKRCASVPRNAPYADYLRHIAVFYLCESIMEAYPPFGPGVSVLSFWLFSAIILKRQNADSVSVEDTPVSPPELRHSFSGA